MKPQRNLRTAVWSVLLLCALMNMRELNQQLAKFAAGGADFKIFYTGSSILALGGGHDLFDLRMQSLVQSAAYPPKIAGNTRE